MFALKPMLEAKRLKDAPLTDDSASSANPEKEAKKEALFGVLHAIERSYGKGSIQKLGESASMNVETTPSGSLTLDIALGGGYPRGRVVEIYGPESSGKTTLALHAVAEIQKAGGTAAFIDAEHALDPVYARNLGVNVDELYVCQVSLSFCFSQNTFSLFPPFNCSLILEKWLWMSLIKLFVPLQ